MCRGLGSVREGSPVLRFIGRRSLGAVAGMLAASIVIFAGTQLLPGNAASVVLGRNGSPEAVKALNTQLHLDKPAVQLYGDWLGNFVQGDLGNSAVGLAQGEKTAPIWPLISNPVKNSVILAVITALPPGAIFTSRFGATCSQTGAAACLSRVQVRAGN